jgi:hypothetical protein
VDGLASLPPSPPAPPTEEIGLACEALSGLIEVVELTGALLSAGGFVLIGTCPWNIT